MNPSPKFDPIVNFIKAQYPGKQLIGLHEPVFIGNERKYVVDAIDSTFVSSVGPYVNRFEELMTEITGAKYAVAIVNGTSALHLALMVAGVRANDEVLSQSLTFIATANAISYIRARCIFIDVDLDTLGMSPVSLLKFLEEHAERRSDGYTYNKVTGKKIAACVPMHTFGLPCRIDEIATICKEWNLVLVEDAAESLGSYYQGIHTGVFGELGVFSFNGNKTVTAGGGGAIVTNNEQLAKRAKHLSTQAKLSHKWEFVHDEIGYNYRMPNINAALACAQLEQLPAFLKNKRELSEKYRTFFNDTELSYIEEIPLAVSNYWINAVLLKGLEERNAFLDYTNARGIMTRPVWELMSRLKMFELDQRDDLRNSKWLADRVVNLPSGFRL